MAEPEDQLLTVDQVAELLKINPQTVRNRIEAGELLALRLGRRVRIQRSVLEDLIGWQRGEAPPPLIPRESAKPQLDRDAAASAVEHIGSGVIRLAYVLRNGWTPKPAWDVMSPIPRLTYAVTESDALTTT